MSRTADRARVWPDRDNTSPAARRGNGIGFRTFAVLVAAVLPHKSASAIIAFARRQAIKGVIRTPDAPQHEVMRCRAGAQQPGTARGSRLCEAVLRTASRPGHGCLPHRSYRAILASTCKTEG